MEFVDLKSQYAVLKTTINERIHTVIEHGQFIMGPEVAELEEKLAERTGSRFCIGCASGTDALLIALMALGVGPGDEVITTPFTFVATAETIALLGARPVFVDIDPRSYNFDPKLLDQAITPRTRAIVPVSLFGQCADLDPINALASERGIPVVEDAAQSFGATYKGRQSCNLSTIGCTSFFPSKPLGCYGDGGACFTNDGELAARMRQIRVHGQDRRYHHALVGINGRLDTIQAAVVLAKLEAFDAEIAARVRMAASYNEQLSDVVTVPYVDPHNTCVYAQYTIQTDDRQALQDALNADGIPTAVHYPVPLHLQPAFVVPETTAGSFPRAEAAAHRVLSLPAHPYLSDSDQMKVVEIVRQAVSSAAICSSN
jgi:UDP-2-acetamido-2-deoxy-ribo-hexuluronate aminotransferase